MDSLQVATVSFDLDSADLGQVLISMILLWFYKPLALCLCTALCVLIIPLKPGGSTQRSHECSYLYDESLNGAGNCT